MPLISFSKNLLLNLLKKRNTQIIEKTEAYEIKESLL